MSNARNLAQYGLYSPTFRNRILNGQMKVAQRGTSFTVNNTTMFTLDRWRTQSIGSSTVASQQGFALGTMVDASGETERYARHVVTSVAGAGNFTRMYQTMENVRDLAGQTCVLSFKARADVARKIGIEAAQLFGTGGAPSAAVTGIGAQQVQLDTVFKQFSFVIQMPSIAGKTLGSAGDDGVELCFWMEAGANLASRASNIGQQSGTFDIADVQLERGAVPSSMERPLYVDDLLRCQRYYQKHIAVKMWSYNNAGSANGNYFAFPVTMRVQPTVTLSNVVYSNASGMTAEQVSPYGLSYYVLCGVTGSLNASADFTIYADL